MKKEMCFMGLSLMLIMLFFAGVTPVPAKTYTFTTGSAWEKGHPSTAPLLHFMDSVNARCKTQDGEVKLRWIGGPETFKARDLPAASRSGSINLFTSSTLYYGGSVPEANYPALPYAWSFDNASEMYHSGIEKLVNKGWKKKGLMTLKFDSFLGFYFFFRKPVSKVDDFKGKKLRTPGGLFSFTAGHLGAVSTRLASGEVYGALQRGTIDGGLQPMPSYVKYGYWEVSPYLIDYPLMMCGANTWMDLKKFNSLPKSLQNKMLEIGRDEETYVINYWRENTIKWTKKMKANGTKFITLSPEDQKKMAEGLAKLKQNLAKIMPPEDKEVLFGIYDKFSKP